MSRSSLAPAHKVGIAVILAAGLTQPLAAQSGSLQGRITDTSGTAVVSAQLTVDRTGLRASPTSRGAYRVNGVPVGRQVVRVKALAFEPESLMVTIVAGQVATVNFTMHRGV